MADDFASLFASTAAGSTRGVARLHRGDVVQGVVVHVGSGGVFLDVGAAADARLEASEFTSNGRRLPSVGDALKVTVIGFDPGDMPKLSLSLGRGEVDAAALQVALESELPVQGRVTKAVKAGLEVSIGGLRAFCPASQVERGFAAELEHYVGQELQFRVTEIKEGGRSVIVSRRALLEAERVMQAHERLAQLVVGSDVEGTVQSVHRFGALIDLGGVEGLVHISELARGRVDRVEDVVNEGDTVTVRVLGIEASDKGPRVRLSLKAREPAGERPAPARDEVLKATVLRVTSFGVFVETSKGEGLVPVRELELPPGSDHRRAYPPGREVEVVVLNRDAGGERLRFSMKGVDRVLERNNVREYAGVVKGEALLHPVGSFGAMLRTKLGLPDVLPIADVAPPVAVPAAAHLPPVVRVSAPPAPSSQAATGNEGPAKNVGRVSASLQASSPAAGPRAQSPTGPAAPSTSAVRQARDARAGVVRRRGQ